MPINDSIPLRAVAPEYKPEDMLGKVANVMKIKADKLDIAAKQNDEEAKLLSQATPENWGQIRQYAVQKFGEGAAQMLPETYDKTAIDNLAMSRLDIKDKLSLLQKEQDSKFDREKFDETKRHNKASEGMFGNSFQGKAYDILLNGDPSTPEYALASSAATRPRYQQVTAPDGTVQLVAVKPELPDIIKPPAGSLTPPPVSGTQDATPTTPTDQLLAPPSGYSVTPIAGTQQAAKPTEGQSNAGLYVSRMEDSAKVIDDLVGKGYKPNLATDTLADSALGNGMLTPQGQKFTQAKRDFINAVLRRESGAAIAPSEFVNANKQYFPQPGDSKEVLEQKKQTRSTAIEGIKNAAGPAYKGAKMNYGKMSDAEIRKSLGL